MEYPQLHFTSQVWRPPYGASSQLLQSHQVARGTDANSVPVSRHPFPNVSAFRSGGRPPHQPAVATPCTPCLSHRSQSISPELQQAYADCALIAEVPSSHGLFWNVRKGYRHCPQECGGTEKPSRSSTALTSRWKPPMTLHLKEWIKVTTPLTSLPNCPNLTKRAYVKPVLSQRTWWKRKRGGECYINRRCYQQAASMYHKHRFIDHLPGVRAVLGGD